MQNNHPWYALFVKPQKERTVETILRQRQFETFSPSIVEHRPYSDRVKKVETPLFPSYVFCRFDAMADRLAVLTVPGVSSIAGFGRQASPVEEEEVAALMRVTGSGAKVDRWEYVSQGDEVEIMTGSMAGVRGIFIEVKGSARVVLSVELLKRSIAVELDRSSVRPLTGIGSDLVRKTTAGGIQ